MCGIAGILNIDAADAPTEGSLRSMLGAIRHRGPDEFGMYLSEQVGLGSARLSIIDLGGGQQPISNETGTLWIVFNGEIFNYLELRPDLEARGHRFTTSSDTEVLLHLYEEYGPDVPGTPERAICICDLGPRRRKPLPGPGPPRGAAALLH